MVERVFDYGVRWDGQVVGGTDDGALPGLALSGLLRSVRTPDFAGVTFHEVAAKSALNKVPAASQVPFRWTINPMRGCLHACRYCFARPTHEYLDLDAGKDFETQIVVKTNVVEVLQAELSRPSWRREHVALGTNTDPYQRAEGRYRLMPGIIEALGGSGTPLSVLTKGTLLRRDLPLLSEAARSVPVSVAISLAVVDEELQAAVEPGTPTPRARLELIKAVRDAGLTCGVLVAPVMPYLTDSVDHLDDLLSRLAQAGATSVTILPLHLRGSVKPWFFRWLAEAHPRLVAPYRRLYGSGAYLPAEYTQWLHARVDPLIDRYGFARGSGLQGPGGSGSSGPGQDVGTRFGHRGAAAKGTSARTGRRPGSTVEELPDAVGAVGPQGTLF